MKFEITVAEFDNVPSGQYGSQTITSGKVYRYDCYIDDVYMTFGTWREKQDIYTVYQYFIKVVLREWKTKYKNKYTMNKITKHDMERLNQKTIVNEDIQDIELTLKQANTLVRLQKMEGDF